MNGQWTSQQVKLIRLKLLFDDSAIYTQYVCVNFDNLLAVNQKE